MSARSLRILAVYGTRPEAIKMAPVVAALRQRGDRFQVTVCATGQHREMAAQAQDALDLRPDLDLGLMRPNQSLNDLAADTLARLDTLFAERPPDWLLVQGDTTTAMAAALAAFHRRVAVGHVEAGLRTGDLDHPYPEEANRRVVDLVARALFAPTERAVQALRAEGRAEDSIHLVGNTVVDALLGFASSLPEEGPHRAEVLVTVHRRESFGAPMRGILGAIALLAARFPAVRFVYPVHPNPNVRGPAHETLGALPNVELHEPFSYAELVTRLARCRLVLTDSGGIQEEAPSFGKPVLVLRERTERPEGIEAGIARLVGVDPDAIVAAATALLEDPDACGRVARIPNPYGDGRAAERIVAILAGEPWQPFTRHPALQSTQRR